jgi:serine-type D-Ala-D-Ala carboxypeptidase/endopeptidase (penicillin-binding protein 4)
VAGGRANPVIVVISMAVTVSMALLVGWQWVEAAATVPAEPTIAASADPAVQLTTPLLSLRRAPGVLSRSLNSSSFRVQLAGVLEKVDDASCVSVAVDGAVVSTKNPGAPVIPASNMKLVVGAVALELLGPNYGFRTVVTGDVGPDGVVAGDLNLVGGGDPVLGTDWWPIAEVQTYPPINTTRLEALADAVVAAGVTRVGGRVVGDGSRYDDEWFGPTWDPSLKITEAGPYDALLVNDARTEPTIAAADPALGAAEVFTGLLRDRGLPVSNGVAAATSAFTNEITAIDSQPLAAIVAEMLLTSDDNTAELLVKELGVQFGAGGTTAAGLQVIRDTLTEWGIAQDGITLVDGSGLARDNRLTCAVLIEILARTPIDAPLGAGLPVAAQSGTLTDEFVGSPVAGAMRAKTGSLSDVKALSGYLPAPGGDTIQFALILNSPGIDDGPYQDVWNALAAALVTYPASVSSDQLGPR